MRLHPLLDSRRGRAKVRRHHTQRHARGIGHTAEQTSRPLSAWALSALLRRRTGITRGNQFIHQVKYCEVICAGEGRARAERTR